jgi:hypothetical protein
MSRAHAAALPEQRNEVALFHPLGIAFNAEGQHNGFAWIASGVPLRCGISPRLTAALRS